MVDEFERLTASLQGRYVVERELGRGGMGVVYLAHDDRLDRPVALKFLRSDLAASVGSERFLREMKLAGRLRHPHIVGVHDAGEAEGRLYCVMAYVEGETLEERLGRVGQLPLDEALRITREVADALEHAHQHGVLHRDVKPGNILLADGGAMLADFGVARALGEDGARRLTRTGLVLGTPRYMSPEQATGESGLDARSDQYSLACVLYEMLAGEPPFTGRSVQAVIAKQLTQVPAPLSAFRDTIADPLDSALRRALSRSPADRFPTIREFIEALESGHRKPPARASAATTRQGRAIGLGIGVLLLLGAGWWLARGGGSTADASVTPDTSRYVVYPFVYEEPVGRPVNEVQRLQDALARWSGLSVADPFQVQNQLEPNARDPPEPERATHIARQLGAGRYVQGLVSRMGDSLRVYAGLYQLSASGSGARLVTDHAVRIAGDLGGVDSAFAELVDRLLFPDRLPDGGPAPTATRSFPARQAFDEGNTALRAWDLVRADSTFSKAVELDPDYAQANLWLALARAWSGNEPARWRIPAQRAYADREELSDRDRAIVEALVAEARDDLGRACPLWERITELEPRDFTAWYGLGRCLLRDDAVLRDPANPSGWGFRTSYHQAFQAYRRAFELLPSILTSFRRGSYESLRQLFMIAGNRRRTGRAVTSEVKRFYAEPTWRGDSLNLIPYPAGPDGTMPLTPASSESREAVHQLRLLFRDVALSWVGSSPRSADAVEALSIALSMLGDASALDTLQRAISLARDPDERRRMASAEVWMRLAFSLPEDLDGLRRVRHLADSLLAHAPQPELAPEPLLAAGLAVLTGRGHEAVARVRTARAANALEAPPQLAQTGPALLVYAALGGPRDSLINLERRVQAAVEEALLPEERTLARHRWLARPATLAFPDHELASVRALAGQGDYLLDLQAAWSEGDTAAVRRGLRDVRDGRRHLLPAALTIDALYPEADLLLALGDARAAADWLDPTLRALPRMAPHVLASPERAAALVRTAALRSRIAGQLGESRVARQWADAVLLLWTDADAFLRPLVDSLRSGGE